MKKNEQGNGGKLGFKLVLNKLKIMGGTTFIYTLWEYNSNCF